MLLKEMLAAIEALGLDPETTEVVLQPSRAGCFSQFEFEVCDYEFCDGGVVQGEHDGIEDDPELDPRPLPHPVLAFDTVCSAKRKPITFK